MFLRRKDISQVGDEELIAAIRKGDRNSMGGLWDRYAHLLFGVGMKYMKNSEIARDLVVEIFTDLPNMLRKHEVARFRPWVHTVMRNRCLMELRNRKPTGPLSEMAPLIADESAAQEAALHEYTLQQLEQAVAQLDHGQRTCITLFYLEQNSYRQVSETTGLPLETVRSNIQNGRRNLRIILQKHGHRNT